MNYYLHLLPPLFFVWSCTPHSSRYPPDIDSISPVIAHLIQEKQADGFNLHYFNVWRLRHETWKTEPIYFSAEQHYDIYFFGPKPLDSLSSHPRLSPTLVHPPFVSSTSWRHSYIAEPDRSSYYTLSFRCGAINQLAPSLGYLVAFSRSTAGD